MKVNATVVATTTFVVCDDGAVDGVGDVTGSIICLQAALCGRRVLVAAQEFFQALATNALVRRSRLPTPTRPPVGWSGSGCGRDESPPRFLPLAPTPYAPIASL